MSVVDRERITIESPDGALRATFVPSAGMLCSSLEYGATELLAQNQGVAAYAERGATMGIPLLYPWANRLAGFSYSAAGLTVELPDDRSLIPADQNGLPIHGVVPGLLEWGAERRAGGELVAVLTWGESLGAPYGCFPFDHVAEYRASFVGGSLAIEVSVAAGERPVPVSFGFHPYLSPGGPRGRYAIGTPAMRHLALDARQIPTGSGEPQDARRFELGELTFDDGYDGVADGSELTVAGESAHLSVKFETGYPNAQVYAPAGRDFVCFEPMSAPTNALCESSAPLVAPGERFIARFSLTVSDP